MTIIQRWSSYRGINIRFFHHVNFFLRLHKVDHNGGVTVLENVKQGCGNGGVTVLETVKQG